MDVVQVFAHGTGRRVGIARNESGDDRLVMELMSDTRKPADPKRELRLIGAKVSCASKSVAERPGADSIQADREHQHDATRHVLPEARHVE